MVKRVKRACKNGTILFNHRWQLANDLAYWENGVVQFYFNTSYDRRSYGAGRLDIVKLPSGSYRVQGIEYPKKDTSIDQSGAEKTFTGGLVMYDNAFNAIKSFKSLTAVLDYLGI